MQAEGGAGGWHSIAVGFVGLWFLVLGLGSVGWAIARQRWVDALISVPFPVAGVGLLILSRGGGWTTSVWLQRGVVWAFCVLGLVLALTLWRADEYDFTTDSGATGSFHPARGLGWMSPRMGAAALAFACIYGAAMMIQPDEHATGAVGAYGSALRALTLVLVWGVVTPLTILEAAWDWFLLVCILGMVAVWLYNSTRKRHWGSALAAACVLVGVLAAVGWLAHAGYVSPTKPPVTFK